MPRMRPSGLRAGRGRKTGRQPIQHGIRCLRPVPRDGLAAGTCQDPAGAGLQQGVGSARVIGRSQSDECEAQPTDERDGRASAMRSGAPTRAPAGGCSRVGRGRRAPAGPAIEESAGKAEKRAHGAPGLPARTEGSPLGVKVEPALCHHRIGSEKLRRASCATAPAVARRSARCR